MRLPRHDVVTPGPAFRIGVGVIGLVLFVAGWRLAVQEPLPNWELDVVRRLSEAPGPAAAVLWPVMQLGSFVGGLVVCAASAAVWRDVRLTVGASVAFVGAWFLAKVLKQVVDRGRPADLDAAIVVRDGAVSGLGFPSGHAAVAFALATALAPALGRRGRLVAYVLAVLVALARLVYGVHFPADVIGGAGLGLLCGLAAVVLTRWPGRSVTDRAPAAGTGRSPASG